MIAKGKSISYTAISIKYAHGKKLNNDGKQQQQASFEVDRHGIYGDSAKEIIQDFRVIQSKSKAKNNTFQFIVSPAPDKGKSLSMNDWKKLSQDFVEALSKRTDKPELLKQSSISYLHIDRQHRHLHIYVNRIEENGKAMKDGFLSNYSALAAQDVCEKMGWETARQVQERKAKKKSLEDKALYISKAIDDTLHTFPGKLSEFVKRLKTRKINTILKFDSKQILRGVSFEYQEKRYKASEINRKLSAGKITAELKKSAQINLKHQNSHNKPNSLTI